MKNTITAILFFFAASFMTTGLLAQMPEPVHGKSTDQEIQKEDDKPQDRTYKPEATKENTRSQKGQAHKADKGNRGNKGKATKNSGCEDRKQENARNLEYRDRKEKNNRAVEHETRTRKVELKKEEKYFKKHPIFERRADARNGKGEK